MTDEAYMQALADAASATDAFIVERRVRIRRSTDERS